MLKENREYLMFPRATLERLKLYHRLLSEENKEYISSEEVGEKLGIPPEQVRKDLSYLEYKGKPKVGYHVKSLLDELNKLFGLDKNVKVVIIGAGNLGSALTNYPGFANYNIEIVGIFDNDNQKIGKRIGDLVVLPLDYLERVIKRFSVEIGVICVPKESAQKVAELLVNSGVKAIWNFAPTFIKVPNEIIVKNEDISLGLLSLKHMLEVKKTKY
ncbi:MAG: redox-sensing transcriptional repressor Rex [Dictyoglomus sp.]|nr:redox-sensing transcriptional repressor Rex [Dictyoglomus sp.]MCX7941826.1 redox-sensing transcriptional repressor Rex [Dictyoglomaceae bacterium]MDW8188072.1 redox-sensing transcriptional repressor Rex [Dictyoglomus sp.]